MGCSEKKHGLLRSFWAGLLDLLLPGLCPACNRADVHSGGLCDECNLKLLSLVALPYCLRCGSTLGLNLPAYPDGCPQCPNPLPRFDRVFRLGPYADPLRPAIRNLKYRGRFDFFSRLGDMLGQVVRAGAEETLFESFDVILPAAMHWSRKILRGGDHATLLADVLGKAIDVPVGSELVRIRNTPPQVHLSRTKRIENVRGAFAVASKSAVKGARILLVDDVTTTCATAGECARTLLNAGASKVSLAVIAKSEKPAAYTQHWET